MAMAMAVAVAMAMAVAVAVAMAMAACNFSSYILHKEAGDERPLRLTFR